MKAIKEVKDIKLRFKLVALNYQQSLKTALDDEQDAEMTKMKLKYEALSKPIIE